MRRARRAGYINGEFQRSSETTARHHLSKVLTRILHIPPRVKKSAPEGAPCFDSEYAAARYSPLGSAAFCSCFVPLSALQTGPQGQYMFVVKADQTVELRPVTVGRATGTQAVIADGLKPGETVVSDGQIRLVPGSRITLKSAAPGSAP